jgi:hypothetical protein
METVNRYGTPVVSKLVYDRTKEQRDFWMEKSKNEEKIIAALRADLYLWLSWFGSSNQRSEDTRKLLNGYRPPSTHTSKGVE